MRAHAEHRLSFAYIRSLRPPTISCRGEAKGTNAFEGEEKTKTRRRARALEDKLHADPVSRPFYRSMYPPGLHQCGYAHWHVGKDKLAANETKLFDRLVGQQAQAAGTEILDFPVDYSSELLRNSE